MANDTALQSCCSARVVQLLGGGNYNLDNPQDLEDFAAVDVFQSCVAAPALFGCDQYYAPSQSAGTPSGASGAIYGPPTPGTAEACRLQAEKIFNDCAFKAGLDNPNQVLNPIDYAKCLAQYGRDLLYCNGLPAYGVPSGGSTGTTGVSQACKDCSATNIPACITCYSGQLAENLRKVGFNLLFSVILCIGVYLALK